MSIMGAYFQGVEDQHDGGLGSSGQDEARWRLRSGSQTSATFEITESTKTLELREIKINQRRAFVGFKTFGIKVDFSRRGHRSLKSWPASSLGLSKWLLKR